MKRTPEDDAFAAEFGRELNLSYAASKSAGVTDQAFAKSIGVERAQLEKYLRGEAMPSVRTVVLAYRQYGIAITYERIPTTGALPKGSRRKRQSRETAQFLLPFTIRSEGPERVGLKFRPVGTRKFALEVTVKKGAR
jgi:transcriptional regulator with XRE-family HTH domain